MRHKRFLTVLRLIDAALLIILAFGFILRRTERTRLSHQTALLNVHAVPGILRISVDVPGSGGKREQVLLQKDGQIWTGSRAGVSERWPADVQAVQNLISTAASVCTVSERATTQADWERFGLADGDAAVITFSGQDGAVLSQIFFGARDALTRRIFFRTYTKDTVYELADTIATYLTADPSFWADPFLYPQCVTGYDRRQSEALPRHGRLTDQAPQGTVPLRVIRKDFENGASATLSVHQAEDSFIVIPAFTAGPAATEAERETVAALHYRYALSGWTLQNLP